MAFSYVVRIAIDDAAIYDGFVGWLRDVHLADVREAGALASELVMIDVPTGQAHVVEARYRFASRDAFREYETSHAAGLRAQGLAKLEALGASGGSVVTFSRITGEIVAQEEVRTLAP